MAWYDAVADYTAVPFIRGGLIGGAQFLNWGLGKVLPRAVYPEEYERMNRDSLERAKDIFAPYKTAGDGKGNAVTTTLEFASGMVGGGAVAKAGVKAGVKGGAKVLSATSKLTSWVAAHVPKVGNVIQRTGAEVAKAKDILQTAQTTLADLQKAGAGVRKVNAATRAVDAAKTALADAQKAPLFSVAQAGASGTAKSAIATKAGAAVKSLADKGYVDIGGKLGSYWSRYMPYSLGGVAADAAAGAVNNALPAFVTYGQGAQARSEFDSIAGTSRDIRDSFYRDVMAGQLASFSTYPVGADAGSFLRSVKDRTDSIAKMTDANLAAFAKIPAGVDSESHRQIVETYRKAASGLPGKAMESLRAAYKDNPAGYRKLLEDKVDREIIPTAFKQHFKDGLTYDSRRVWTGNQEVGKAISGFRERFLGDPKYEQEILTFKPEDYDAN